MALPGPWFVQPALVGCHSFPCANSFQLARRLSPKMSQTIPSLSTGKCKSGITSRCQTLKKGKNGWDFVAVVATNLRTNFEMYIWQHHACCCNHDSYLLCAFSKLAHAKVTAMVLSGLEHEKAAVLHQKSFVSLLLFFVFSPTSITNHRLRDEICPWLYLWTPTDLEWGYAVGPENRGFALVLFFFLKKKN